MEISDIFQLINDSQKIPTWLIDARNYATKCNQLVTGEGFETLLSKIEHIEKSEEKWKARKKYSKSIKDLFERILRPTDNVYNANGGSKYYDIKSGPELDNFIKKLSNVRDTKSLQKWLEDNWLHVYMTDPNGLIFIEYQNEETAYPTYKSIHSIRNYKPNGQNVDWILFEPEILNSGLKKWRFVDNIQDLTILENNKTFTIIEEESFLHPFGICPATINSNIIKIGSEQRLSFIDSIIELTETYLRDMSILLIIKFLNGFKTLVRPRILCPTCHGTKRTGTESCKDCDGKGFVINRDITDEIILPIDIDKPDVTIPQAAGFAAWIGLDTETWNQYNSELKLLEEKINQTLWGSKLSNTLDTAQKTMIEVWSNTQPVIISLNKISDVAEWQEWQMTELLANFYIPNKDKQQYIATINYGKNFILDPPELLLERYNQSMQNDTCILIKDRQLNEYITTKFKNDPESLSIEQKKKQLEPYIYYKIDVINSIFGNIEAKKKIIYPDWVMTLTYLDWQKPIETLKLLRDNYFSQNIIITNNNNQNG